MLGILAKNLAQGHFLVVDERSGGMRGGAGGILKKAFLDGGGRLRRSWGAVPLILNNA